MTDPRAPKTVLVNGATGYIGRAVSAALAARGHRVRAFVREGSQSKAPPHTDVVIGDPYSTASIADALDGCDALIHLIGTPHPSPAKATEFEAVDLPTALAAIDASAAARVAHLVYVSVAHPAPLMRAYIDTRMRAEATIAARALNATIVRPWYVLGPGHRWPWLLIPFYALARLWPGQRVSAERLGLCTLGDLVATLFDAVESGPPVATRVVAVPETRRLGSAQQRLGGAARALA